MTRETWKTRFGFVLAAAGWSIGLGNIWRFPYVTGKYGGGAFVLLYLICLFVIGIPLFIIEYSLGRESQSSITTGLKKLAPKTKWFIGGWFAIIAVIFVFAYYSMLMGWVAFYLFKSLRAKYLGMSAEQIRAMYTNFTESPLEVILWQIGCLLVLGIIVSRGLVKGVEAFSKVAMPVLFLLLLALGIYSMMLPGAMKGVEFYLKPDLSKISFEAFLVALGQVFFSIGVGFGASWVYGSYLSKKADVPGDSTRVALMDTVGALLAGFIIFPAAFAFGINPGTGYDLIFVTLPNVFGQMPGGFVFGILFFFLVTVAAYTSAIADTECISSFLMDELKWDRAKSRAKAVWLTILGIFIISIPGVLSFGPWKHLKIGGQIIFGFVDSIATNVFLVLAGLSMALFVGWHLGIKKFMDMANQGAKGFRVKPYWGFLIKYVIPLVIISLLISNLVGG
jgi:NSS family neurotransmitter:Na+ symporter